MTISYPNMPFLSNKSIKKGKTNFYCTRLFFFLTVQHSKITQITFERCVFKWK